ncbi:MAG: hypothetical protein Ct9H300mP32_0440 [Verrucomicrobiota bacterium]|nr:MAG: hypothetical protein Ct9H300mP32_0440 [Verrucomicrobiota bacterium]
MVGIEMSRILSTIQRSPAGNVKDNVTGFSFQIALLALKSQ